MKRHKVFEEIGGEDDFLTSVSSKMETFSKIDLKSVLFIQWFFYFLCFKVQKIQIISLLPMMIFKLKYAFIECFRVHFELFVLIVELPLVFFFRLTFLRELIGRMIAPASKYYWLRYLSKRVVKMCSILLCWCCELIVLSLGKWGIVVKGKYCLK